MVDDLGKRLVDVSSISFMNDECFSIADGDERIRIINIGLSAMKEIQLDNHIKFIEVHCFAIDNKYIYGMVTDKHVPKYSRLDVCCGACISRHITDYLNSLEDEDYHIVMYD